MSNKKNKKNKRNKKQKDENSSTEPIDKKPEPDLELIYSPFWYDPPRTVGRSKIRGLNGELI